MSLHHVVGLLVFIAACSDAESNPGIDSGASSTTDAGSSSDASIAPEDAGEVPCWEFLSDDIFAVPVTFDESAPTWNRPSYDTDDPSCPAPSLSGMQVPREVHAYCNATSSAMTVGVELLMDEEDEDALDDPLLVIYWGIGVPSDPLDCAAINDDAGGFGIFKNSEVRDIELAAGQGITVVATVPSFDASMGIGVGNFQVVSGPQSLLDEE